MRARFEPRVLRERVAAGVIDRHQEPRYMEERVVEATTLGMVRSGRWRTGEELVAPLLRGGERATSETAPVRAARARCLRPRAGRRDSRTPFVRRCCWRGASSPCRARQRPAVRSTLCQLTTLPRPTDQTRCRPALTPPLRHRPSRERRSLALPARSREHALPSPPRWKGGAPHRRSVTKWAILPQRTTPRPGDHGKPEKECGQDVYDPHWKVSR